MPLTLFTIPIISTFFGGLLALHFRKYLSLLLAIGAGLLLGAAFLDLLPEALTFGSQSGLTNFSVLALTLLSFLFFYGVELAFDSLGRFLKGEAGSTIIRRSGLAMLSSTASGMAWRLAQPTPPHTVPATSWLPV